MSMGPSPLRRSAAAALLFLLFRLATLGAETAPNADALPKLDQGKAENPLSRFEIVSLGSYPITLFYVDFAFDFQRFIANGRDPAYAPWPFKGTFSTSLSDSERLTRLGVALGVSFAVGALDAMIHASKIRAAERLREAGMQAP
jgi:hypothetical protein